VKQYVSIIKDKSFSCLYMHVQYAKHTTYITHEFNNIEDAHVCAIHQLLLRRWQTVVRVSHYLNRLSLQVAAATSHIVVVSTRYRGGGATAYCSVFQVLRPVGFRSGLQNGTCLAGKFCYHSSRQESCAIAKMTARCAPY